MLPQHTRSDRAYDAPFNQRSSRLKKKTDRDTDALFGITAMVVKMADNRRCQRWRPFGMS